MSGPAFIIHEGQAYLRKTDFTRGTHIEPSSGGPEIGLYSKYIGRATDDTRYREVGGDNTLYAGGCEFGMPDGLNVYLRGGGGGGKLVDAEHPDGEVELYFRLTKDTVDIVRDEFRALSVPEREEVLQHAPPDVGLTADVPSLQKLSWDKMIKLGLMNEDDQKKWKDRYGFYPTTAPFVDA